MMIYETLCKTISNKPTKITAANVQLLVAETAAVFRPTSGEDAGVHEGGHTEVSQNKQEDNAIVDRHGNGETLWKPRTPETQTEGTERL